ncbi:MAG: sigma-70 family RNA polymerase sigma factor [Nanoarchaeota archaeon]|nr:sigma-70 family RNA polymerase sigma factor [Nanoarchaeota archaeon]
MDGAATLTKQMSKSEILLEKFAEDLMNGKEYRKLCFSIGSRYGLRKIDISDLIQEHYLSVSKNFSRNYEKPFDESTSIFDNDLIKYLTTSFHNKIRDYLRKQKTIKETNESSLGSEDIGFLICSSELKGRTDNSILEICSNRNNHNRNPLLEEAIKKEQIEIAIHCLGRAPEKYREILLMHFNGLTYPQISKILDIPLGTVKFKIHYAKNYLREQWKMAYQ